jgi:N-acylglucosamine 2-epimerase/mannose-6-phosphate isomerase
VRDWVFGAALPFWAERGVDHARGGFYEELDGSGRPTAVPFKRTRVICRQTYVFAHAATLEWTPGLQLAERGYEYLVDKAWLGPEKGWARRLSADGAPLDVTSDLYDLAFVLFALAWFFKASGDTDAVARARGLVEFVNTSMRANPGPGFLHNRPASGLRQQNPHMHLLEACLVAYGASKDSCFLDAATEIVGLFRTHFFDGRTLAEYFDDELRRAPGEEGRLIEPGHHFEWAWILARYQQLTGTDLSAEARALVSFAEAHGVDKTTHVAFNQVRDDGTPIDRGSRTWPNTERIKGHLALFELGGHDPRAAVTGSARVLLDRYLATTPRGGWVDHFDAAGRPVSTAVPASTLYHLFLAFAELLRLEPQLTAWSRM